NQDALTYTVTAAPSSGAVTVDAAGQFTYTPTQSASLTAGTTPGADSDSFTVTVSDGQTTTDVQVRVPLSNQVSTLRSPVTVGTNPMGAATTGGYTYVANQSGNTVSVIDTHTNTVVSTIKVGSAPTGIA